MASNKKIEGDIFMESHHAPPIKVPEEVSVFVLTRAVVTVQVNVFLPKPILGEEVVEVGNDSIGTLAAAVSLIYEVVYLLRNTFTADTKQSTLPGNHKVNGPGLERVTGVVDL